MSWAAPIALHAALALGSDPFVLEWDDAVGCADAAAVVVRVRQIVGDELARGELRRPVVARGTVRAIPRGVELVLVVDAPALERRIEAPDCAGIVEAAALVLATSAVPERPLPAPEASCPPASPMPMCPRAPEPPPPSTEGWGRD